MTLVSRPGQRDMDPGGICQPARLPGRTLASAAKTSRPTEIRRIHQVPENTLLSRCQPKNVLELATHERRSTVAYVFFSEAALTSNWSADEGCTGALIYSSMLLGAPP